MNERNLLEQIKAQQDMFERTTAYMDELRLDIENQRDRIKEQNKEIIDSINYAKLLQQAILANDSVFKELNLNGFILNLPKNIIGGDLPFVIKSKENLYVAAIDCTGHGIPGAMLSMLSFTLLKNLIDNGCDNINPSHLIDELKNKIKYYLNFNNSETKSINDGVEISLLVIDYKENLAHFSTTQNPLYLLRKNKIELINALKEFNENFERKTTTVTFKLENDMQFYLMSDGYQDQFGGISTFGTSKKFKRKNIVSLLSKISRLNEEKKREILLDTFHSWKGDVEQTDDILIMHLKYSKNDKITL